VSIASERARQCSERLAEAGMAAEGDASAVADDGAEVQAARRRDGPARHAS
jgi:hypothetical protein